MGRKRIDIGNTRNSRIITYQDKTQTLTDWAEEYKIDYHKLHKRLKRGWSIEKALLTHVLDDHKRDGVRIFEKATN